MVQYEDQETDTGIIHRAYSDFTSYTGVLSVCVCVYACITCVSAVLCNFLTCSFVKSIQPRCLPVLSSQDPLPSASL